MNDTLLDEVLTEYYDSYLREFESVPEHKFSLRHRIKMKKIFRLYEKNVQKLYHEPVVKQHETGKVRFNKKTVLAIMAIVLLSVIAGCAVAYFVSESFRGTVHDDNTQLFAINVEGAPTTIEYTYNLFEPPQGFKLSETGIYDYKAYVSYSTVAGDYIIVKQYVKCEYSPHFNTELDNIVNIEVNGHNGIFFTITDENNNLKIIAWDNGDYILEIVSNIDKNILVDLAKMLKMTNL